MITEADFYKQVFQEFKDLNTKVDRVTNEIYKKMDNLHGETNEQIKDLCDKLSTVEKEVGEVKAEIGTHLAVNEALELEDSKKVATVDRKFYIIIAVFGVGITGFEVVKTLLGF